MDFRAYWLWLVMVFGAASQRMWQLGSRYYSAEDFVNALLENGVLDLNDSEIDLINKITIEDANNIISKCEETGIDVYCYQSEGYPKQLKKIAVPPAVLFCRGNLDFLNNGINVAVIGTRKPSEYSMMVVDMLCTDICKHGCGIITGLADGIDQLANIAAINAGNFTCGVCGKAIDVDYPLGSEKIRDKISDCGALISETCSLIDVPAVSFSKRNRILVGLADVVVFIECSATSRGLDNANHAISQGKQVFVVPPHDISNKRYFGQRELIRKGCKSIFTGEDLIYYVSSGRVEDVLFDRIGGEYNTFEDSDIFKQDSSLRKSKTKKRKSENSPDEKYKKIEIDYSFLDNEQQEICRLITGKAMLADNIAAILKKDITSVLSQLTMLELEGIVKSLPGKMFTVV